MNGVTMARRHNPGFVGRRWAVARIADWLQSDSPSLVVAGPAGAGKSALVTAAASGRHGAPPPGTFHAIHVCKAHVPASTDPIHVLAGIAGQLDRSVPGYNVFATGLGRRMSTPESRPAELPARAVLDSAGPSMAFDRALLLPFEAMARRRGRGDRPDDGQIDNPVVVVIDGLDEAPVGAAMAGLVDLLAERLATPIPGLRLLLTMRSGPALDLLRPDRLLDLSADRPPGADDVREYLDAVGILPARRRAAVASAAGDCFLYADVAMRLVATGGVSGPLPSGLGALYDEALARVGEPGSPGRVALTVLARTRDDGLTIGQVATVIGADRSAVAAALNRGRQLLTGEELIRPHHRCLSEHLWASASDPAGTDWSIARHLHERVSGRWLAAPEPYVLRNVLAHLADAALLDVPQARQAMSETVTDPDYVTAALLDLGVDDLLSTLSYVERRTGSLATNAVVLSRILRRQARALRWAHERTDATLATQQIVYEAATCGAVAVSRRFAGHLPETGVLTLWASADNSLRTLPDAIPGHAGKVTSVVVTSDGTRAISTSQDNAVRVWRLASGRVARTLPALANVSNMYAEPATGHVVASTTDGRAQVWDADLGAPIEELTSSRTVRVTAFATNETGTVGVGGDYDGNATVWDLTVGEPIMRLPCGSVLITAVAITPDGSTAATGSYSGELSVWDLDTGERILRLRDEAKVGALALSPAADRLLVGSDSLAVYQLSGTPLSGSVSAGLLARLLTSYDVTATVFNPAMPQYALVGGARGQVAYVRLPVDHLRVDPRHS
jgi:hypothetical protein